MAFVLFSVPTVFSSPQWLANLCKHLARIRCESLCLVKTSTRQVNGRIGARITTTANNCGQLNGQNNGFVCKFLGGNKNNCPFVNNSIKLIRWRAHCWHATLTMTPLLQCSIMLRKYLRLIGAILQSLPFGKKNNNYNEQNALQVHLYKRATVLFE